MLGILSVLLLGWLAAVLLAFFAKQGHSAESKRLAVMNNICVRFMYEAAFELFLCALINVSDGVQASDSTFSIVLSYLVIALAVIAVVALASLLVLNGP